MGNTKSREEQIDIKFLKVQGLYSRCDWDEKHVRSLISARKLNPCFPGEDVKREQTDECPICMLYYPGGLNRSLCCKQPICTECFFQVKKTPKSAAQCPFCNAGNYNVFYKGKKTEEERREEEEEEQRVIELRLKMMKEQEEEYQKKKGSSAASSDFSQSAPSSPQATTSSSYAAGVSPAVTPVRGASTSSNHHHHPSSSASRALNFVDDADMSFPEPSPFRTPERIPPPPRYQFSIPQPPPTVQSLASPVQLQQPQQQQPQRAVPGNLSQYVPEHILRQTQNEEEIDDMLLREAIKASVESAKAQSSNFTEVDIGEPAVPSSNINIFNNIIINNNNTASVGSQPRARPAVPPPVPHSTPARVDNTHRTPESNRNIGQSLFDLLSWDAPLQPQSQPQSQPQQHAQSSAFSFEDFFQPPPSSNSSFVEDNPVTPPPMQRPAPTQQHSPQIPLPPPPQHQLSPEEEEEYQLALAISLSLASSRQAM